MRDFVVYDAIDATLRAAYEAFGRFHTDSRWIAGFIKLVRVHDIACEQLLKLERS